MQVGAHHRACSATAVISTIWLGYGTARSNAKVCLSQTHSALPSAANHTSGVGCCVLGVCMLESLPVAANCQHHHAMWDGPCSSHSPQHHFCTPGCMAPAPPCVCLACSTRAAQLCLFRLPAERFCGSWCLDLIAVMPDWPGRLKANKHEGQELHDKCCIGTGQHVVASHETVLCMCAYCSVSVWVPLVLACFAAFSVKWVGTLAQTLQGVYGGNVWLSGLRHCQLRAGGCIEYCSMPLPGTATS